MARAQFTWEDDGTTVRIVDLNRGALSVTNDAENVIARLVKAGVPVDDRRVIYQDSDGHLDRLLTKNGVFAGFALVMTTGKDGLGATYEVFTSDGTVTAVRTAL
jgi:hypothetical protein